MSYKELKQRKRSDYKYFLDYRLRWSDNDVYHHLNNNIYMFLVDSIVNEYLITRCGRSPRHGDENGLMVNSGCNFFSQIAYPSIAELGLRVNQLGNTSATFEVGIFEKGSEEVRAVGGFTHVFCDMKTMKPQKQGMCDEVRKGLEAILVAEKPRL